MWPRGGGGGGGGGGGESVISAAAQGDPCSVTASLLPHPLFPVESCFTPCRS